jgi:hypothetical protein
MDPDDHAMLEAIVRHGRRHQIDDFLAQGDRCGWCRCPIRLRGFVFSGHPGEQTVTFSSFSLPDGVVLKACGYRSVNEHALHTWDIEVTIDQTATVLADSAAHIVDNLELIARFTARPPGSTQAIAVRTDQPRRDVFIELSPDAVTL